MTFNSVEFALFFALALPLYWIVPRRAQNLLLVAASYVFYGWWDERFLLLLASTTLVDYFAVRRLEAAGTERARRAWLVFSVGINLVVLGFFKYFNFFVDSAASLADRAGIELSEPTLKLVLPVGISFYVFHEISYAVDVYRRRVEAERDLLTYAVFIAFFPQLVAGPITRASHMLPQFRRERHFPSGDRLYSAAVLILSGLFKKVVLADGAAKIANEVFGSPEGRGTLPLTIGMLAFTIQIYGDFAGYTDIARGVSRLLGIELARNFEQPYLSTNITQFWRTWHISLSTWLHDYLYVPLGGNRGGSWRTYRNLFLTMLLGGLWHGASWTFVAWGAAHGIALAVHRATGAYEQRGRPPEPRLRDTPRILSTFVLVSLLWVLFRADSFGVAADYFRGLVTGGLLGANAGAWKSHAVVVATFLAVMFVIDLVDRVRVTARPLHHWSPAFQGALAGAAVVGIVIWSGGTPEPFIYFQF